MDITHELYEYADLNGFEVELSLTSADGEVNADLSFQSAESFMTVSLPLTGNDLTFLAGWFKDALRRYQDQLDGIVIEAELED